MTKISVDCYFMPKILILILKSSKEHRHVLEFEGKLQKRRAIFILQSQAL